MDTWANAEKIVQRALREPDPLTYIAEKGDPRALHYFRKAYPDKFDLEHASDLAHKYQNVGMSWYLYALQDEDIPRKEEIIPVSGTGLNALPSDLLQIIASKDVGVYQTLSSVNRRFHESVNPLKNVLKSQRRAAVYFVNFDRITKGIKGSGNISMYLNDYYRKGKFKKIIENELPPLKDGDVIVTIHDKDGRDNGLFMWYQGEPISIGSINDNVIPEPEHETFIEYPDRYHPRYWENVKAAIAFPVQVSDVITDEGTEIRVGDETLYLYQAKFNDILYYIISQDHVDNLGDHYDAFIYSPYIHSPKTKSILQEIMRIQNTDNVIIVKRHEQMLHHGW